MCKITKNPPCQKLRNGLRTEDWGGVTIGNTVDISFDIFIFDDRDDFFKSVTVSVTIKAMSLQVLNMSIASQDFSKHTLLNLIGVFCDFFNELKGLLVFVLEIIVH